MKTTHTPGTWYKANTGNHQALIISEETGENIAVVYDKKNAAMIEAAPEMYEALKAAKEIFALLWDEDTKFRKGKFSEASHKIYSTLTKAEGRAR